MLYIFLMNAILKATFSLIAESVFKFKRRVIKFVLGKDCALTSNFKIMVDLLLIKLAILLFFLSHYKLLLIIHQIIDQIKESIKKISVQLISFIRSTQVEV